MHLTFMAKYIKQEMNDLSGKGEEKFTIDFKPSETSVLMN